MNFQLPLYYLFHYIKNIPKMSSLKSSSLSSLNQFAQCICPLHDLDIVLDRFLLLTVILICWLSETVTPRILAWTAKASHYYLIPLWEHKPIGSLCMEEARKMSYFFSVATLDELVIHWFYAMVQGPLIVDFQVP